ncbi:MAG: hypothetical protein N2202_07935 [Proteobacteria bacterium]|nr:hypothetical protein [Pseudomonadota bacterium]
MIRVSTTIIFLLLFVSLTESKTLTPPFGLSHNEAIRLGERLYREGILSSGEPATAIVQNDITVDGPMLTCAHCHLRSGFGGYEGKVYTLSTNAEKLFKPRLKGPERRLKPMEEIPIWFKYGEARPAYNDETLARAIKYGEDPTGRELSPTMPRYILNDKDMAILIYYLKHLNPKHSPGVDYYYITFATIVTEEVSKEMRNSFIQSLEGIVKANNAQTRHQEKRAKKGPWTEENMNFYYRRYKLIVWELKGSPSTWYKQLESYYKKNPVFAVLSGISTRSWEPIHRFCEKYQIPNIFPITDLPVISENDWYTLYFSKGFYQEGDITAKYLNSLSMTEEKVLIIYDDTEESKMLLNGFLNKWKKYEGKFGIFNKKEIDGNRLKSLIEKEGYKIVLIWLKNQDFQSFINAISSFDDISIFASSTLLGVNFTNIPLNLRRKIYFTYPYSIDDSGNSRLIDQWTKFMKINATKKDIVAKVYTIGNILTDTFMMVKGNFYRDYFLDIIDMQRDRVPPFTNFDRLSFGQGQRYASKGGYIIKISEDGKLIKQNEWIIH